MTTQQQERLSPFTFFDAPGARVAFDRQVQLWCEAQSDFLTAWQSFADGWFEHRRQGLASTAKAFGDLCACHDLNEASSVQQQWLAGVLDRVSADAWAVTQTAASAAGQGAEAMAANGARSQLQADRPPAKPERREKSSAKEPAE
jgi:hypothetical protein